MPSSTRKSRPKIEHSESDATIIARLTAQLAEYDQKLRQVSSENNNRAYLAEKLMKIADEAIVMAQNVQLIKFQEELDRQRPNYNRMERWFREAQSDARKLVE